MIGVGRTLELAGGDFVVEHLVDVFQGAAVSFLRWHSVKDSSQHKGLRNPCAILTGRKKKMNITVTALDPSQIYPTMRLFPCQPHDTPSKGTWERRRQTVR